MRAIHNFRKNLVRVKKMFITSEGDMKKNPLGNFWKKLDVLGKK